jgi:hypothetical protein
MKSKNVEITEPAKAAKPKHAKERVDVFYVKRSSPHHE